jgi:hypothetical protein
VRRILTPDRQEGSEEEVLGAAEVVDEIVPSGSFSGSAVERPGRPATPMPRRQILTWLPDTLPEEILRLLGVSPSSDRVPLGGHLISAGPDGGDYTVELRMSLSEAVGDEILGLIIGDRMESGGSELSEED